MKRPRVLSLVLAIVALGLAAVSCSDQPPIGPESVPAPQADLIGDLLGTTTDLVGSLAQSTGLLKCSPLPYDSETKTIGTAGGTITVGPHRLVIPSGALSQSVTITAVAPSGKVNVVQFEPEGLQFAKPATLTMSYANCSLLNKLLPKRIAYVDDNLNILEYLLSLDLLNLKTVTGQVQHFSGYAVAW